MPTSNSDREAVATFTVTREYSLEGTFKEVARALGVTVKQLAGIIDDGDGYMAPDDCTKLIKASEMTSEDVEIDEIVEA